MIAADRREVGQYVTARCSVCDGALRQVEVRVLGWVPVDDEVHTVVAFPDGLTAVAGHGSVYLWPHRIVPCAGCDGSNVRVTV